MNRGSSSERARSFAAKVHVGQVRPNKARDSILKHLEEVAEFVRQSGGSDAEVSGAWLHDSVEDTETKVAEITGLFGEEIGAIVDGMTDPSDFEGLPIFFRKTLQAERIFSKSVSVKRVKLADQISNVRSVIVDPPAHWKKQDRIDYIQGAKCIADQCRGISDFLDGEFEAAYQHAAKELSF